MRFREILIGSLFFFVSLSLSAIDAATEVGPLPENPTANAEDAEPPAESVEKTTEELETIVSAEELSPTPQEPAADPSEATVENEQDSPPSPPASKSTPQPEPEAAPAPRTAAVAEEDVAPQVEPATQTDTRAAEAIATQAAASLATLERLLIAQQDRQMEVFRETNRLITIFGVGFAVVGIVAMILAAWFQYRGLSTVYGPASDRQSTRETSAARSLMPPSGGETPGMDRIHASGERFQGRMSSLERRLAELEELAEHGTEAPRSGVASDTPSVTEQVVEEELQTSQLLTQPVKRTAILLRKAETLIHMGRAEDALEVLDEAETGDADFIEINLLRGQAFEKLGRLGDALQAYERAEELDTTNASTLLMKAGLLNRQERFDEALQCYERALQLHRENT